MSGPDDAFTISHAGVLPDMDHLPGYLVPGHTPTGPSGAYSCAFCGVGDAGRVVTGAPAGTDGAPRTVQVQGPAGPVDYHQTAAVTESTVTGTSPTTGCVKLRLSMHRQRGAYPVHVVPSVKEGSGRRPLPYQEAIGRLAELLLEHRPVHGKRTLVYCCGQIDYFSIFAMQETLRLLGVRNLTGNAEHCLNSGAVHNEILTGQEGPFLTVDGALSGPGRFFLLNGWNGFITHPPIFRRMLARDDFDGFLVEVQVTETAKAVAKKLGPERVLLIRPRSDPHLALAVAHEILRREPEAVDRRFVERFGDPASFDRYAELASSPMFEPERVAQRIAPEPRYFERLHKGILTIARKLTRPQIVPINMPSVGLSQTSGVVAHCLWGSLLAMLGKYGLRPDSSPAGGTLRVPGQINAESEVQGLSRKYFMGRVPMDRAEDAARRMDLPDDAYAMCLADTPRAALDYSDPTPGTPELFLFFGTQFETNMMGRPRWLEKLADPSVTTVVVDPIPDRYSVEHAALIVPSPPHSAVTKLFQNGEWRLSLSVPQKRPPPETRSDATILYDAMAEITRRIEADPALAAAHPDLARHAASGYLQRRFGSGLSRIEGEVSRVELWQRIQEYMSGGDGPLYCRPEHADGRLVEWQELLDKGSLVYGGVGENRFVLDHDAVGHTPFRDIYRRPARFRFFVPTQPDLAIPTGVILSSGRSCLSDDRSAILFATSTFNSGKATTTVGMPDENALFLSPQLAARTGLRTGDRARVTHRRTGASETFPAVVSDRVKGDTCYVSFHKTRAQIERGTTVNTVTDHEGRCPYSGQTTVKLAEVLIERAAPRRALTVALDTRTELPRWGGQSAPLYVTEIIHETADVATFRFQGDPLCRFVYSPGQFCTLVLDVAGEKVLRSYTISSTPTRPYALEITVKRVPGGLVSNWLLDHVKVGDRIEISGPRGKFCLEPGKAPPKLLLIGAGSGITPLMSMARWLHDLAAEVDVKWLYSVKGPGDIIFEREIALMASRSPLFSPFVTFTGSGIDASVPGLRGRIERAMLEQVAPDVRDRHVYLCGPRAFMESIRQHVGDMGLDLTRFHSESFGGVRTGMDTKPTPLARDRITSVMTPSTRAAKKQGESAITFARSGVTARAGDGETLLDVAEAQDVDIDYSCRVGSCGHCKVRLIAGEVTSDDQGGLAPDEKAAGYVLTCVARPRGDCTLDS